MDFQTDGEELFIEMEAIVSVNIIIIQQKKLKHLIKMEIKYLKKYIQHLIENIKSKLILIYI